MDFLTLVFGAALVIALLTGKAYFRGVHERDDDPRQYWSIVGCYAALALAGLVLPALRHRHAVADVTASAPARSVEVYTPSSAGWFGRLFTDGATRLAGELEDGAARVRRSPGGRVVVLHHPQPTPDGCGDDYKVQFSRRSALVMWCSTSGSVTASHATTSHLRAVDVPQTWIVDKRAGEALRIGLEREGDRVVVTSVD